MLKFRLLVIFGACSYGLLSTFVKKAYTSGFSVGDVAGSQALIGVVILWALVIFNRIFKKQPTSSKTYTVTVRQVISLMFVGMTTGMTGMFYYAALQYLTASFAILMLFQFTWIGILLESLLERRRPGKENLLSLIVLFVGITFTSGFVSGMHESVSWIGVALGLASAVMYAFFIRFSEKTAGTVVPILRSALMITGSSILVMLVFPPYSLINLSLQNDLWKWGLLLALFGVVIPPVFYAIGVPKVGGGLATILSAAELPAAVIVSFIALNEPIGVLQWSGVVITLIGIALPQILRNRKQSA
ncbi:DMT family transporter [Paenibacillus cymbidii]|uniref:DMT family transporter n=1 Tax=Paenibacillus cymbidii TaxID=1639034 RepID=UPI001F2B2661|nr:DMT family transporter [Paenibacillus cymbidii]